MFTTVLPVWGVALLVGVCCWSIGAALVASRSPIVGMLAGWCVFLFLCALPWMLGVPANWTRPFFWLFFVAGVFLAYRRRRWNELAIAAICAAVVVLILGAPFLVFPGLLAYGAHGTDMWGYVNTAEWVQSHSIRQLPEIGVAPMRFNWTWHVLQTRERPLIYESLACFASATGLGVVKSYLAYPVALIASLAMALTCEPRAFRLKSSWLVLPLALLVVVHPMIVLPWIAGYLAGAIATLFIGLAFASAAVSGHGAQRNEALGLSVLMILFCAALYSTKLLYVALAAGGAAGLASGIAFVRAKGWRSLPTVLAGKTMAGILGACALMMAAIFWLGRDQPVNVGDFQTLRSAGAHLLSMFGGNSPYVWLGYYPGTSFDRDPLANPVGIGALVVTLTLFVWLARARWHSARDVRIPILVGLCLGVVAMSIGDEITMAKTLALFGFSLLMILAVTSGELRHWTLALVAGVICCLPFVRSAAEMEEIISGPYIACTEKNIADIHDGQDWRILSYLAYKEDTDGFDWPNNPKFYFSNTQFLPIGARQVLAKKYHMPSPTGGADEPR